MNTEQVKNYCQSLAGAATHEFSAPANVLVYALGEKRFAYFKTSEPEKWRFSIRVSPEQFLALTDQPGIRPARYIARFHWVTIVNVATVPEDYLKELIRDSYLTALRSLSKKAQAAIELSGSHSSKPQT